MKSIFKYAAAVALTGALAVAAASPSEARNGRNAAAAIGFGAGALVGAAAASAANNSYYYGPGYYDSGYAPGYAYEPAPVYGGGYYATDSYAYSPRPNRGCWVSTDSSRGYGYYGSCASSTQDTDAGALGQARTNKSWVR
jgi:hypothetical protein